MRERLGTGVLARRLDELCDQRSTNRTENDEWRQQVEELRQQQADDERQRQENWAEGLRAQLDDLRDNRFFAPDLHTLAQVYLGIVVEADQTRWPRNRIHDFIGGEQVLVDAVMAAIRGAVLRDDLPEVDETIALHQESRHSWMAYPVLASLHLLNEEDSAHLDRIDVDRKRKALAIHYCVRGSETSRSWHDRWFQQEPELVLEVLYRCAVPAVRSGEEFVSCLNVLDSFTGHEDLVHEMRLRVLDAIPTRGSNKQMGMLDGLLARAMQHPDGASLRELASRKLALKSMGVGQRVRWMAVDALLSGGTNLHPLKEYVCESAVRVQHLVEFLRRTSRHDDIRRSVLPDARDPEVLRDVIEILGPSFGPVHKDVWGTLGMEMSDLIGSVIEQFGALAGDDASEALRSLIDNPRLERWRDRLNWSHERQRVVHRDASYRHPDIQRTQQMLRNDAPANAADLAALLVDRFDDISEQVRGDNNNVWRQFWNEEQYGRPHEPKTEDSCRDALLAALKARLPAEVDAAPEGRYAAENRADIRVSCAGFNVPVEVKKNSHRDLWSALRRQLIAQYTTDPATSGYGVYLVLWFGAHATTRSPDGERPATPEALRQRLGQELTPDEARKISVIVMDVTKPGEPPALETSRRAGRDQPSTMAISSASGGISTPGT